MKTPKSMTVKYWGDSVRPISRKRKMFARSRVRVVSRMALAAVFAEFRAKNRHQPARILAS
jgi:hypothetical protein